jgi:hypothetical protein
MAIYYVDSINGDDTFNGLGPDASHATNKPWKSIGKLLGATGLSSGDSAYLAPGVYRGNVSVGMATATATTLIEGDINNAQGFKNSSGVRVAPGPVVWTAYAVNDTTVPSTTTAVCTLAGRDYLHFKRIIFVAGGAVALNTGHCIDASTATSTNTTFEECVFYGSSHASASVNSIIRFVSSAGAAFNTLFDRCCFVASIITNCFQILPATISTGSADYDVGFTIRNSLFLGPIQIGINFAPSGTLTYKPGGLLLDSCQMLIAGTSSGCVFANTNTSTAIPLVVRNSILCGSVGVNATTSGMISCVDTLITCTTRATNVTLGATIPATGAVAAPMWLGFERTFGWMPRQPFSQIYGASGAVGFTAGTSPPSVDATNRPRPAGGQSTNITFGAFELGDTAVQETTTVDASGSGIKITGPGYQEFRVPVNASSTTIKIKLRYDTNHGTTNKPQAILLDNTAIGVSTETKTMTSGVDTWEELSFTAFTPTAKGVVTLRLVSRSAAGNGIMYADTVSGA